MPPQTMINAAHRSAIAKGLARGATYREVCEAAKISKGSLERWLVRASKADLRRREKKPIPERERPFLQLYDEMREAEADVEFDALQQITQHLQIGVDLPTAARAAKVPQRMLEQLHDRATQFLNRYEDGDRLDAEALAYLELFEGFEQAVARAEVTALASLQKAMASDWHAATWWLERMHPEKYASANKRKNLIGGAAIGRPMGASSAPDRPSTADPAPPRIRLRQV